MLDRGRFAILNCPLGGESLSPRHEEDGMPRYVENGMKVFSRAAFVGVCLMVGLTAAMAQAGAMKRVQITGEVIDSWCYLSEIMYALGTAHHQCALWCAAGGIPTGILGEDGQVYVILKLGDDDRAVANPAIMEIQTHKVTVEANLIERDGINYLLIDRIVDDSGVVNETHEEYGIQPFGD
jgi:hypothetical protein